MIASAFNPKSRNLLYWLIVGLVFAVISIVNYLPAFDENFEPFAAYQRVNLSSTLSRVLQVPLAPSWPSESDQNFQWEFMTAKYLIMGDDADGSFPGIKQNLPTPYQQTPIKTQLPLWRWDDRDGGRPLLAISAAPVFYPLSQIYYYSTNLIPLAVFHFWLALLGTFLLAVNFFPFNPKIRETGQLVLLAVVFIILPQLRIDFEIAAAWWLIGLALVFILTKSFMIKLLGLSLVFTMLWLSVGSPTSPILIGLTCGFWLLVEGYRKQWRFGAVFKVFSLMWLAVGIGLLLAAPQVFPRWFDSRDEAYQLPGNASGFSPQVKSAGQVKLVEATRLSETEITYELEVGENSSQIQLIIPERYDDAWTAQYRSNSNSDSYTEATIEKSSEGWRVITIPALTNSNHIEHIEIKTMFKPQSFEIGLLCFYFGLTCLSVILIVSVFSFLKSKNVYQFAQIAQPSKAQ